MHSRRITEKVKDDYSEIAQSFSDTRQFPWKDFDLFLPFYRSDGDVLDLGCGNGRLYAQFLKKHGFGSYLGVDQVENLIELARKDNPDAEFLLADISRLPELGEKYDAIFAIASFHHIPPILQLRTLKSWNKALKPGGYLFMTNWNLWQRRFWPLTFRSILWPSYGFLGVLIPWQKKVLRYYYAFTKRRLSRLLTKAGFKIELNCYVQDGESAKILKAKNILTVAKK
jgi:SAM-dependent methyltransferase